MPWDIFFLSIFILTVLFFINLFNLNFIKKQHFFIFTLLYLFIIFRFFYMDFLLIELFDIHLNSTNVIFFIYINILY